MFTDKIEEISECNKKHFFSNEELNNYSANILYLSSFIRSFQSYLGFSTFYLTTEISIGDVQITLYKKDDCGLDNIELTKNCWLMEKPIEFAGFLGEFEDKALEEVKREIKEWE